MLFEAKLNGTLASGSALEDQKVCCKYGSSVRKGPMFLHGANWISLQHATLISPLDVYIVNGRIPRLQLKLLTDSLEK